MLIAYYKKIDHLALWLTCSSLRQLQSAFCCRMHLTTVFFIENKVVPCLLIDCTKASDSANCDILTTKLAALNPTYNKLDPAFSYQ